MSVQITVTADKPYNKCITCTHIGVKCDGPNFLAMTIERLCEWMRLRKESLGWTNARVAQLSQISVATIERIMSGNVKDIYITTLQAILKVLVNGTWGQYPCAMAAIEEDEESADAIARCAVLEAQLAQQQAAEERKIAHLKDQIEFTRSEIKFKNQMLEQKNVEITLLLDMVKAKS